MERKLAVAGNITAITPIENADRVVSARVNCGDAGTWMSVVRKDEFRAGENVIVFLQDALLPPDSRWEFLESDKWVIRMRRFRGAPSECLIVKLASCTKALPRFGGVFSVSGSRNQLTRNPTI